MIRFATLHRQLCRLLTLAAIATIAAAPAAQAHDDPATEIRELSQRLRAAASTGDLLRRAELYRLCGEWTAAERDLRQVGSQAPGTPDLSLAWTALDLDRGRTATARRRVERLLAAHPDDARAVLLAVRVAHAQHDDAAVARRLGRATELLASPSPDLFIERAAALSALARPADALRVLDDAIARLGPTTSLTLEAARIEARLGRLDSGLARIETLAPQYERSEPIHAMRRELVALEMTGDRTASQGPFDDSHLLEHAPAHSAPATSRASHPALGPTSVVTTLVPFGATWRYDTTGVSLGSAWQALGFGDTAWPQGPAPLGFGETYIATPVKSGPDAVNRYPTIYFRRAFTAPAAAIASTSMTLTINYDDGFVAYLNGTEIARRGIAAGPVDYSTLAVSHEAGTPEVINVTASLPALVTGDNMLAIEVHQTSLISSDLVLDADLRASTVPQLSRGPYLQVATPSSIVIRWRTDVATGSVLRFGVASNARNSQASDTVGTTEHELTLTGLQPETRYWYTPATLAEPLDADTTSFTFVTPPLAGVQRPTRFWIIGDSGLPGVGQDQVRDAYLAQAAASRPADLWLMLGDNAYTVGSDTDFQNGVFTPYRNILKTTPLWPTRGNHDILYAGAANDYYDLFTMPLAGEAGGIASGTEAYYSFDRGDIHVICLDSEGSDLSSGGGMLTWLSNDLAATSRKWRIAFWHHPPYTKGSHDSDNDIDSGGRMGQMRANALPILEAAGVDLVLTGHSHNYERSMLLDEHYGPSATISDSMVINAGDGRPGGNGAYEKPSAVLGPHEGAVYSVVGSSSQIAGGSLNHPAMKVSLNVLGSMILDIDGNRLEAQFLDNLGAVRDSFVILKGMTGPHTLVASALAGGTIFPSGSKSVPTNAVETYTITPDAAYGVADVIVDGFSRGPAGTWTFTHVQANHTIQANFALAAPVIASIRDVPADQGGAFAVRFRRSSRENAASAQPVTAYEAYRAVAPALVRGAPDGTYSMQAPWELVATIPATAESVYSAIVPTLADSGSAPVLARTTFYVSARTANPSVFWDAGIDSGYSVDNLAPAAPLSFTRTFQNPGAELRWAASPEPDVVLYRVYRDTVAGFTPGPENLVLATTDTVVIDNGSGNYAYALQAVDRNGNASAFSRIEPGVLGVTDARARTVWLGRAAPNPTSGRTRIEYGLSRDAHARLTLFDVGGRVIRRMVDAEQPAGTHHATWDGRDESGQPAPDAIYFYELNVDGRVMTGRLVKVS